VLNCAFEELGGLRHDLRIAERYDEPRTPYPLGFVEPEP
jgi:hypothetical protein